MGCRCKLNTEPQKQLDSRDHSKCTFRPCWNAGMGIGNQFHLLFIHVFRLFLKMGIGTKVQCYEIQLQLQLDTWLLSFTWYYDFHCPSYAYSHSHSHRPSINKLHLHVQGKPHTELKDKYIKNTRTSLLHGNGSWFLNFELHGAGVNRFCFMV